MRKLTAIAVSATMAATAPALAQDTQEPEAEQHEAAEALALDLARVCVNESGWGSPADCAMIWQTVRRSGRTDEARQAWLRRHSWTLFTEAPVSHGNARWTRDLNAEGERPRNWPSEAPSWEHYEKRWASVLRYATGLVKGAIRRRPCPSSVVTWGGEMDSAQALRRGLVPLECEGTINTGYARPPQEPEAPAVPSEDTAQEPQTPS